MPDSGDHYVPLPIFWCENFTSLVLEEDLAKRPFATLQDRCDYMEVMSGLSVSRSTVCRAISRIGTTRKKGGD